MIPSSRDSKEGARTQIVEKKVSAGNRDIFDLNEFLSRPLFAHLAHHAEQGLRESPVWFHWDGDSLWIIGGTSFPKNLKREPMCAIGVVDWDLATGRSCAINRIRRHHGPGNGGMQNRGRPN